MSLEKSAATQMTDYYGKSRKGLETLPWITVLNKQLLEKFGVEVPENLAGKPIILRDGSASHTEDFFHLADCGLDKARTLQVMA